MTDEEIDSVIVKLNKAIVDCKGDEGKVSKEDHERLLGEKESLTKELDDLRAEVLSPEYVEFIARRSAPPKSEDKDKDRGKGDDGGLFGLSKEQVEGMSKADILRTAQKFAEDKAKEAQDKVKEELTAGEKETIRKEVAVFERSHADYSKYKPVMYGLSTDAKNADLSLQELYDLAKAHVKALHEGATEAEKDRARRLRGEKPGGSNEESFEKYKTYTPEQAAREALEEVKADLGPLPSA